MEEAKEKEKKTLDAVAGRTHFVFGAVCDKVHSLQSDLLL
jgi:hypothetical protein